MKKYLWMLPAVLMLTGCYTSQDVVKITEFDRCMDNTFNELSEMGYYPSGDASSSKSEMVVTGVYYSQRHGLQTSFGNETTNTYYFSDGDGGSRGYKKKSVIQKIQSFFEKYFGL